MSEIVFLVGFFVLMMLLILAKDAEEQAKIEALNQRIKEMNCPPHSWKNFEQPGEESVTYLACSKCNKLPSAVTENEEL